MMYPEPERGRGKTDEAKKGAETASFSYRRVQEARYILRNNPLFAKEVAAAHAMIRIMLRLPPVFFVMSLWLAFVAGLVWLAWPRRF